MSSDSGSGNPMGSDDDILAALSQLEVQTATKPKPEPKKKSPGSSPPKSKTAAEKKSTPAKEAPAKSPKTEPAPVDEIEEDADEAERIGTINRAMDADEIGPFVDALAKRIALWPSESINATKQCVIESIDVPIIEALKGEAYWLYQATSQTSALKRFKKADEDGAQFDMENQRTWPDMVEKIQAIN